MFPKSANGRFVGRTVSLVVLLALLTVAAPTSRSSEPSKPSIVAKETLLAWAFAEHGVQRGTFVLRDGKTGALTTRDAKRAATRFIPASTFKIPNSLIGLETGAVGSVDEVLPYGGKPQRFKQWEHDMPLREAIVLSAVPIYQELARRVGLPRMQEWVKRLGYGNAETGAVVDQFWLEGPLKISAVEQTEFLLRLVNGELPGVSAKTLAAVGEITILEKGDGYVLHAKTGWGPGNQDDAAAGSSAEIGWWVGWVERPGKPVTTFALNLDLPGGEQDAAKRVSLGRACLRALGVLPPAAAGVTP